MADPYGNYRADPYGEYLPEAQSNPVPNETDGARMDRLNREYWAAQRSTEAGTVVHEDLPERCLCMTELQDSVKRWTEKTFPDRTRSTIVSHLLSEAAELYTLVHFEDGHGDALTAADMVEIVKKAADKARGEARVETADVVILALDLASYDRFNVYREVVEKMEINRARSWKKANEHGFFEHEQEDTNGGNL